MKKLFLTLIIIVISCISNAQTIGNHFNSIKSIRNVGEFNTTTNANFPYTYVVNNKESKSVTVYVFNQDLICKKIAVYVDPEYRNIWVKLFNDAWVTIDSTSWRYYLDNGMIIYCKLQPIEDIGLVFIIEEEE